MKIEGKKRKLIILSALLIMILTLSIAIELNAKGEIENTSNNTSLSTKKIEWGIKRSNNHEQPDVGSENTVLINKYNGMAIGSKEQKYVYLTFELGYEAGYTEKILDALKEENVQGAFFITAHYVNTASDVLKRMIDEGHIVGNHIPKFLMSLNYKIIKC